MMANRPRLTGVALVCALGAIILGCGSQQASVRKETFEARKKLAGELVAREEWQAAFAYLEDLHRERPDDAAVLVLRGIIYRERGLSSEAEADLLQALKLDTRAPEGHAALGILYDVTLRGIAAEKHHREAVKLAPKSFAYLNNLGFSLFLRGKHRDAIGVYQQAARLSPTNRRLRTNLGFAYAASGDLGRAAREFTMGGTPAEAKNNLGFAYERRGDMGHAFDLYLEAARLDPKSNRARSNLVHAAEVLGKPVPDDIATASGPTAPATTPIKENSGHVNAQEDAK
jgi:Flp pilus assembly protein TadD